MIDESLLRARYEALRSSLNERGRRLNAAAEAKAAGYGGIAAAARATKVARSTIGRGLKDLQDPGSLTGKVRRKGGGGPLLTTKDPTLLADLQRLLEPATMGDPMRPLVWVSKSHEKLATALRQMGHKVSSSTVPKLLRELKYCRHYNRKTKESGKHPIATRSSNISTPRSKRSRQPANPRYQSTRKRRNCSANSRTAAATMGGKASRSRSIPTISRTRSSARLFLTASTTSAQPRLCEPRK